MLPLVIQIGAVQIEPVTPRLPRVHAGTDEPSVLDAIRRAHGCLDGTGRCYWVEAVRLRQLEAELRAVGDLFRYSSYASAATVGAPGYTSRRVPVYLLTPDVFA